MPPTCYDVQHFHYDSLDSTNVEARRLWRSWCAARVGGAPAGPFAVRAATQTAGVGRAGRTWKSPHGGLWLSVAWPAARALPHYQSLPLAVGVAAVRALIDLTRLDCRIKWPNDILLADRKLAGILCQAEAAAPAPEACPGLLILGIGINANFPASMVESGGDLRLPATSLRDALGREIDLPELTRRLLAELESTVRRFEQPGDEPLAAFLPELRNRLAWRGQVVSITDEPAAAPSITGQLIDINSSGELVLETPTGRQPVAVGDVRLARLVSCDS